MSGILDDMVRRALGTEIRSTTPLQGGCIGEVFQVALADGRTVVAKVDQGRKPRLDVEGYMLQYLRDRSDLPVPEVLWSAPEVLIMSHLPGGSHFSAASQVHAAELLGALHAIGGEACGLDRATLIGGLHQPNPWTDSWVAFFRDHRLLYMAREARKAGVMDGRLLGRIEVFASALERFIEEPAHPALLHGDVWTTNVLASGGRITGFLDPAVYYGHPEIELAFITLFSTFSDPFFEAYDGIRGIRPGFFEQRRDIYNLYPLLVHARLFGPSYLSGVVATISRLGF